MIVTSGQAVASVAVSLLVYAVVAVRATDRNDAQPFNVSVVAPARCKEGECKLSLTVAHLNDRFKFSLHAEDKLYVAVALAESAMMGSDKVIECVAANGSSPIEVYHSTNFGPPSSAKFGNTRDKEQVIDKIATNITGGTKDGHVFCSFVLKPITAFPDTSFDLAKSKYFLQIVSGKTMNQNNTGIGVHSMWATTLRAVSLTKDEGKVKTVDSVVKCSGSGPKFTAPAWLLTIVLIAVAWQ